MTARESRESAHPSTPFFGESDLSGRPCEVDGAHAYAFEGNSLATALGATPCRGKERRNLLVQRSHRAPQGPHLAWKLYEVCEVHFEEFAKVDRASNAAEHSQNLLRDGSAPLPSSFLDVPNEEWPGWLVPDEHPAARPSAASDSVSE